MGKINPIQLHGTALSLETIMLSALNMYSIDRENKYIWGSAFYASEIENSPYMSMAICLVRLYDEEKESSEKINNFLDKYSYFKKFSIKELNNSNEIDLEEMIDEFKELLREIKSK